MAGGGLVRSLGGWSQVLSLRQREEPEAPDERILGSGDFVQAVLEETDRKPARQVRARMKAGSLVNQESADYLATGDQDCWLSSNAFESG